MVALANGLRRKRKGELRWQPRPFVGPVDRAQSSWLLTLKGAIEMRFSLVSRRSRFLGALGLCLAVLLAPTPTMAQNDDNGGILPPNSKLHGKTYGEWSAAW